MRYNDRNQEILNTLEAIRDHEEALTILKTIQWDALSYEEIEQLRTRLKTIERETGVGPCHYYGSEQILANFPWELRPPGTAGTVFTAVEMSPCKKYLAAASPDPGSEGEEGVIQIWEIESGKCVSQLQGIFDGLPSILWNPDVSKNEISVIVDNVILIFAVFSDKKEAVEILEFPIEYTTFSWAYDSPGDTIMFSCPLDEDDAYDDYEYTYEHETDNETEDDKKIDSRLGSTYTTLKLLPFYYDHFFYTPDNEKICGIKTGTNAEIINSSATKSFFTYPIKENYKFVSFSPDGKYLAVARSLNLKIIRTKDKKIKTYLTNGDCKEFYWSSNSKFLAVCSDLCVEIYEFPRAKKITSFKTRPKLNAQYFFPNSSPIAFGNSIIAILSNTNDIFTWKFDSEGNNSEPGNPIQAAAPPESDGIFLNKNDTFLAACSQQSLLFRDLETGSEIRSGNGAIDPEDPEDRGQTDQWDYICVDNRLAWPLEWSIQSVFDLH
ncbi:MAG: WD40 repeat domain-containing protein [bacterium]|nr:WD40 repeat domain-containing protein [bacterium]